MTSDTLLSRRPQAPLAIQIVALLIVGVVLAQAVTAALILLLPPPRPPIFRLSDAATALQGGSLTASTGWRLTRSIVAIPPEPSEQARDEVGRDALAGMLSVVPERVRLLRRHNGRPSWGRVVMAMFRNGPQGPRADGPPDFEGGPLIPGRSPNFAQGAGPFPGGQWRQRSGPPSDLGDRGPGPGGFTSGGPGQSAPGQGATGEGARGQGGFPGRGGGFGLGGRQDAGWRFDGGCPRMGSGCGGDPLLFQDFVAGLKQPSGAWVVVRPPSEPFPNDWQKRILLWLGISVALVAPMGYLFARRITAPLGAFARAADRFGKDPASPLMVLEGPAEIGVAARAFNDMQGRLKRYVEDRTAMVGAISHDLRTPLARIRFKLERASPEMKASLASDVAQMEQMISAVLAFIRDASAASTREPLDLLSLLECTVDDVAMMGAEASVTADWSPVVDGDPLALQRLFANLVDNAVKYGGCALITLHKAGADVRVDIADRGPGLPDSELERVFDAFYRSDRSRNLDDGGIGLGLAVARSVAREHGGDVYLTCGAEGLTAHVQLPLRRGDAV